MDFMVLFKLYDLYENRPHTLETARCIVDLILEIAKVDIEVQRTRYASASVDQKEVVRHKLEEALKDLNNHLQQMTINDMAFCRMLQDNLEARLRYILGQQPVLQ